MLPLVIVGPVLAKAEGLDEPSLRVQRCKEKIPAITACVKELTESPIVIVRSELLDEYPGPEIWDLVKRFHILLLVVTNSPLEDGLPYILRGSAGVIAPDISVASLLALLPRVAAGEIIVSPLVLSRALRQILRTEEQSLLTPREQQVFELVSKGMTNRQVAEQLCVTRETVRWHLRGINTKLGKSVVQDLRSGSSESEHQ